MSIPGAGNPLLLGGAAGGYEIERSLRFNSADSAYLSRTPASAGNRKTWTWAGWVKRAALGSLQKVFGAGSDFTNAGITYLEFDSGDRLGFFHYALNSGGYIWQKYSSQVFRDPSAWYHICVSYDSDNATGADRARLYVNGLRLTAFNSSSDPSSGYQAQVNNSTQTHYHSGYGASNQFFSGYLADIHFIDGQALDPSSFGEFDDNGVWQPIEYTGSYGTNGFHLDFADNSAATATTLGKDTSGNGNNWTPNNLSVTAGAGNDSLVDTPTNYGTDTGAGGEVRGNYATLNPLNSYSAGLSNGSLQLAQTSNSWVQGNSTIGVFSGKWYWEVTWSSGTIILNGITKSPLPSSYVGSTSDSWGYAANSNLFNSGSSSSYGSNLSIGDVIGVALDLDAGTLVFYNNGVSQGQAASGLSGTFFAAISVYGTTSENINFGQRPFAYTAPSGFKALCTQNMPAPTITKPSTVMDVALWTGNGSARGITGLGFNPDLVWIKGRSGATDHALYDSVRGAEKRLESNTTDAEVTSDGGVTAFNSDGFSLGTLAQVNTNTATYAGWTWDAGSSTVTNTDGTISSQVRANPSAGFSIVTYTGTGVAGTIGHGLNVAPLVVLTKRRDSADNWYYFTTVVDGTYDYFFLNTTAAKADSVSAVPTSSVINVSTSLSLNANGGTYVSYCFAPVAGYSAFGSYTGNGSADGPFVYTGFRPKWVMVKRSDSTASWHVHDTKRDPTNPNGLTLYPDWSGAELGSDTSNVFDFLSNGFKLRISDAALNANAGTYIWAAFAESPFALARAR